MRPMVLLGAVALCAASATPYQSMGFRGGHRSRQLTADTFFVEARVNSFTSKSTALEYFHRRAAEICQAAGYSGYEVTDRTEDDNTVVSVDRTATGARISEDSKPEVSGVVRCTGSSVEESDDD